MIIGIILAAGAARISRPVPSTAPTGALPCADAARL